MKKSHLLPAIAIGVMLLLLITWFTHEPVSAQVRGRQDFRAPTKWEYKVVLTQYHAGAEKNHEATFNELGATGWEFAGALSHRDDLTTAVFKRPKR